jgi:hypothetical protein
VHGPLAKEFDVPSQIIRRMFSTPPRQIVWLDTQDLQSMGAKTVRSLDQARYVAAEEAQAQQKPDASTTSSAAQPSTTTSPHSWNAFIDQAIAISAERNQGSAAISRSCKLESRECIRTVAYLLAGGRQGIATIIQNAAGNITRREACESNVSNDARESIFSAPRTGLANSPR